MEDTESLYDEKSTDDNFKSKLYKRESVWETEHPNYIWYYLSKAKTQTQPTTPKVCKKYLIILKYSDLFFKKTFLD